MEIPLITLNLYLNMWQEPPVETIYQMYIKTSVINVSYNLEFVFKVTLIINNIRYIPYIHYIFFLKKKSVMINVKAVKILLEIVQNASKIIGNLHYVFWKVILFLQQMIMKMKKNKQKYLKCQIFQTKFNMQKMLFQ